MSHLSPLEKINLGSFYTPPFLVQRAFSLLSAHLEPKEYCLLDSACGAGAFSFSRGFKKVVGVDRDLTALKQAKINVPTAHLIHTNALRGCSHQSLGLAKGDQCAIVGNPPYNDTTSQIRQGLKTAPIDTDSLLKARDLGLSFLRSYDLLKAEVVCVLHPLSYLIKKTNFQALKGFRQNYRLKDALILRSKIFCPKSLAPFPIILALYARDTQGMDFGFIANFSFNTLEGKSFRLKELESITPHIDKHPNAKKVQETRSFFYPLRDINALARFKTFMPTQKAHSVLMSPKKYSLYCCMDIFKTQIPHYPRNCDIFFNFERFKALEDALIHTGQNKHLSPQIKAYFRDLLGEHYL
ncbi:adenine methyltransferase [Helicobacter sp. NHP21005]|uniref:SAM-dependent methyltransferase n=1 Tax=Helicobacter felistomachi TaxID=3040201 RepID=UPI002573328F|nr:SAM-dependent methyltransferase [Helicobacter sp. NHP21005]BEG56363.1 adenine methyltransferase [Helicobacter sp. NHP21005]